MRGDDDDAGVPLAHYRSHRAGVLLTCRRCMLRTTYDLEAVIRRLEARGIGGPQTGIRALGRLAREPCSRCGAREFETRPDFSAATRAPGLIATGRDTDYPFRTAKTGHRRP